MLRVDDTGFASLKIYQDTEDFCYGIDAVLLAHFASMICPNAHKVADLGTGNGIVPLILSHKMSCGEITGIEMKHEACRLAEKSVFENGLAERINIVCSDVLEISNEHKGRYDLVTMNPPYVERGKGIPSSSDGKRKARHETTATIYDFMYIASSLICKNGHVAVVYRPRRMAQLFEAGRASGLEPYEMMMVCPRRGENANIMLVHFQKGKLSELTVLPELIVREGTDEYTAEVKKIYK